MTSACLVASVPFMKSIVSLLSLFFTMGIVMGFVDASVNMFIIHIWGKENPPFMQALHFCYGVGALVAPLIARPFLLPTVQSDDGKLLQTSIFFDSPRNLSVTFEDVSRKSSPFTAEDVKLVYPYSIIAGYFFLVSTFFLTVWKLSPQTSQHPSRDVPPKDSEVSPTKPEVTQNLDHQYRYKLL